MSEQTERALDAQATLLLQRLPTSAPGAETRLRRRLTRGEAPARPQGWRLAGFAGLTAGAALAAAWMLVPTTTPVAPPPAVVPVATVDQALTGGAEGQTYTAIDGVALSFEGTGHVEGTAMAPHIRWDGGSLRVEVEPGRGIKLDVQTREAEVRVIGTGFTVNRSALGTRVEVAHGIVEVTCEGEATTSLRATEARICLPTSADGLAARASMLLEAGAPASDVLESVDRGLAKGGTPGARENLTALRARALSDLGRRAEALDVAHAYLSGTGTLRRDQVMNLAVNAAKAEGGCAKAAPWLLELGPAAIAACKVP
jgi:ferric-dicitrate binding protein FerR (iron transport regulator)